MAAPIYKGGRPYYKSGIRIGNNVLDTSISTAPVDGTSGTLAGYAGPGSTLHRTNGSVYVNTNTKASPTWVSLGVGSINAALTTPTLTTPTITTPIYTDRKILAASATYDNTTTATALTGFSWTVAASGIYHFELDLATTMTTVGGMTISFKLTTATLTSIRYNTYATTAADNAKAVSTTGTTTTDATKMFDSKTDAYTRVRVFGVFVVNAAGTFDFRATQNTAASGGDVSIALINSFAAIYRTA